MNFNFETQVSGHFTLSKVNVRTGKRTEVANFSNLITNLGLNRIGTSSPQLEYCYVGTGTVAPAVTDTNMSAFKVSNSGYFAPVESPATAPDWYVQWSRTYTFGAGSIAGNITEVGIGWNTTPLNSLWSRELIRDSAGNPVTITVLSDEILEVVYTLRHYLRTADFTGSFTLGATTYNFTGRPCLAGSWQILPNFAQTPLYFNTAYRNATALGAITADAPVGSSAFPASPSPSRTPDTYASGSYTISGVTSVGLTLWNHANGVNAFRLSTTGAFLQQYYQILLDKPIPKTDLNTMTFTWSHSWSRYTPPGP